MSIAWERCQIISQLQEPNRGTGKLTQLGGSFAPVVLGIWAPQKFLTFFVKSTQLIHSGLSSKLARTL